MIIKTWEERYAAMPTIGGWVTDAICRSQCMEDEIDELRAALELARMKTYLVSISEIAAERDALQADAERYRWLFGARTKEQANADDVGLQSPLPQDLVIAELSGFYHHKAEVDAMVDQAKVAK